MHARLAVARRELPRAVRIAVAATLAWWISRLLGAERPVFAVIVPMVAIRDDTHAALSLSLGRMLGVMAGVVLGIGVVAVAGVSTSAIVLLLVAGLAVGLFLRTGPELNTQIAISALLVAGRDQERRQLRGRAHLGDRRRLRRLACRRGLRAAARPAQGQRRAGSPRSAGALADDLADARGTLARGDPSARALLAHADEHARAAGRAVEDLPRAAARAAPEPPAARLARAPRRSSTGASGSRCGSRSRCAGSRATSRASRTARTCATSGTRPRGGCRAIIAAISAALGQGARGRGLLARGRRGARADRGLPARGPPPRRGDPAAAARPARRRALGAAGVSSPVPAGEDAEVDALRVLARRLGVADDVRLLSPWTPLPAIAPGDAAALSGAADLLLRFSPLPVLGVTGSAGKTTTARLAEAMLLRERRRDAHDRAMRPPTTRGRRPRCVERVLAARPPAWCVAELTSNHLAVCSASPQIACITNVWPDHVDQHGSLAAYLEAKRRIVAFQGADDWVVVNADDPGARRAGRRLGRAHPALHARRAGDRSGRGRGGRPPRRAARRSRATTSGPCERAPARARQRRTGCSRAPRALLAGATPEGIAQRARGLAWPRAAARAPRRRRRLPDVIRDALAATPAKAAAGPRAARARHGRPDRGRLRRPRRRHDARHARGARALRARGRGGGHARARTPRSSAPPARGSPQP